MYLTGQFSSNHFIRFSRLCALFLLWKSTCFKMSNNKKVKKKRSENGLAAQCTTLIQEISKQKEDYQFSIDSFSKQFGIHF